MEEIASYSEHEVIDAMRERMQEEQEEDVSFEDAASMCTQIDYEVAFDAFLTSLKAQMDSITEDDEYRDGLYHIGGSNIGWRGHSGERIFSLESARELVQKLTPSDYSLKLLTHDGDAFTIRVYHHDSPTGESYKVTPCTEEQAMEYETHGEKAALEAA